MRSSSRWNQPASLSLFLQSQAIPGSSNAHLSLTSKRADLSAALTGLRAALRGYLDADNAQLPALAPTLSAATINVNARAMELGVILEQIRAITDALPQPTVQLFENFDHAGQCTPNQPRRFSAVIDNVAMFVLPNNHEAEMDWLIRAPATSNSTFRLIEDRACLGQPSVTHNLQNPWSVE